MDAIDSSRDRIAGREAPLFASSWLALFRLIRGNGSAGDGAAAGRPCRDRALTATDN